MLLLEKNNTFNTKFARQQASSGIVSLSEKEAYNLNHVVCWESID